MRWTDTNKLIERIRRERPELTVDHYGTRGDGHYQLRVYCMRRGGGEEASRQLVPGSVATLHGPDGWARYKERHRSSWCKPEESFHTDHLGREVDHQGNPVRDEPPPAPTITAEEMLSRIVQLNHAIPEWWRDSNAIKEMADTWGARVGNFGVMADSEPEEVARLSGDCHASILIARTGSGLFASGYAARWGSGGTSLEPTVGSVPYDTAFDARRAAFKSLTSALESGRGNQQRHLLLQAVKERDAQRGLFH